jgi:hypothetical protein
MVRTALNKQIEKQLTHIKDMNEREKNLTSQAVNGNKTLFIYLYINTSRIHSLRHVWTVN